jgi:tRNA uridine 5-carboxymethylaminomethyl modification enzyme
MEGLERVEILQEGYAVEYDHVDPRALTPALAVETLPGLYLAVQINGTTGYEEASAQGLVAGLNAAAWVQDRAAILFDRAQSYIGVMIDDLVLQGVTEPYRMLTARAEYRLRLRADNAGSRLTPHAIAIGCASQERIRHFQAAQAHRGELETHLAAIFSAATLRAHGVTVRDEGARRLSEWLRYPDLDREGLERLEPALANCPRAIVEEAIQDHRYAPYIARQEGEIARLRSDEGIRLARDLDFAAIAGLSNEMVERLNAARPSTLGAAARIRGVTPAALAAILVHARRRAA